MRQYLAIKRELPPETILLFRLGVFWEILGEDAIVSVPICGLILTHRGGTPMCGFPHISINTYLAKFIRTGKSVALCEEVEHVRSGIPRREVTRIITP